MAIIYQNPAIIVCDENNFKSVKSARDITFGELLLVEHVYTSVPKSCVEVIANNEYLFNMYHPRIVSYNESMEPTEKISAAINKVDHNRFGMDKDKNIITLMITKMNHSCDPNCAVYVQEKYNMENTDIVFMELYAIRNIPTGTEITINYGPNTSHNRDFECDCGKDLDNREKIFQIGRTITRNLSTDNNTLVQKLVYQYLATPLSDKILLNHYLATKGIFMDNNNVSAYTSEGEKTINDIVHKYLGINSGIKLSDGLVIEEKMYKNKINLFLNIINDNLLH